jgi:hypothetical protein
MGRDNHARHGGVEVVRVRSWPAVALVTAAAELAKGLRTVIEGGRFRAQRAGGASHAAHAAHAGSKELRRKGTDAGRG